MNINPKDAIAGGTLPKSGANDEITVWAGKTRGDLLACAGVSLDDAWFVEETRLRLRTGRATSADIHGISAFQATPSCELAEVGQIHLPETGPIFADLNLVSPFSPVLFVTTTATRFISSVGILPFPSLCRGGPHYSELRAIAEWPSYMTGLQSLSISLLREFLGWRDGPESFAISRLVVDISEATGAERIFLPALRNWLFSFHGLPLNVTGGDRIDSDAAREYVEQAVAASVSMSPLAADVAKRRGEGGGLTLTVPADALPTLSAIVSRRLRLPQGRQHAVGTYLVAQAETGIPRLSVSLPPLDGFLLPLQPASCALQFPLLSGTGKQSEILDSRVEGNLPLAIRFTDSTNTNETSRLFPAAFGTPVLRKVFSARDRQRVRISVLVSVDRENVDIAPLLRSIAQQTLPASEVIVVAESSVGKSAESSAALLRELFADRSAFNQTGTSRGTRINEGAALATGTHYLIVDPGIVLHDPRTLESLAILAEEEQVATASCVIVRESRFGKGSMVSFFSGGYYPTGASFDGSPTLRFKEIDSSAAFPRATYPVLGNSFRLACLRADVWGRMNGLDASRFPFSNYDLDFALRAVTNGYLHLCTSAVTALDMSNSPAREQNDLFALAQLAPHRWEPIFESATVVRDLH